MKDTIAALATPPGISGLAVIRISGDKAFEIADKCFTGKTSIINAKSHTILYGNFWHKGNLIDSVTASVFKSPNSYTGEDTVEIGCHGGYFIIDQILSSLFECGARSAEPGEFTRRAYLNGKMDITQVEAVADIIHSASLPGAQTAARQLNGQFTQRLEEFRSELIDICSLLELELDFVDEDLEFVERQKIRTKLENVRQTCLALADSYQGAQILRSGFFVGIAGYPNSGKSTLFNKLLNRNRAIVSHIPGTTRDYLEENLLIDGITVRLIDTAGLRDTEDIIEIEGIKLVSSVLEQSNMIIILNDANVSFSNSDDLYRQIEEKYPSSKVVLVQNKLDLIENPSDGGFCISAKHEIGLDTLRDLIKAEAKSSQSGITDVLINQRHSILLKQASFELDNALISLEQNAENELTSFDIRQAIKSIGEITGQKWDEEILNRIFANFCIGK